MFMPLKRLHFYSLVAGMLLFFTAEAQSHPIINGWIINTNGAQGRHYVKGNSTPIADNVLVNVQKVQYSSTWVYVHATGIPAYITGPFLDGNPSLATNQNSIFRLPLIPQKNTGVLTPTNAGNIGIFINGVALFDYRDGVSWRNASQTLAGGPLGGVGDQVWNRDAVVAERGGFDCSKGHPAMGNYHHHQNPSAFQLDRQVISNVCDLYDSDGLYVIDSTQHSPLLGFAYDGFPIYGAYAYKNADGSGGIVRMKSGYQLRKISVRTHYADGTDVSDGPAVGGSYPLGYFREDYEFVPRNDTFSDYLDEHNGRFCKTPEFPNGTYCYFTTVDAFWNSAYPYAVGPFFYGVKSGAKVTSINETVEDFDPSLQVVKIPREQDFVVFPNPAAEYVAVQVRIPQKEEVKILLCDITGKTLLSKEIVRGSTIGYFDVSLLYSGSYILKMQGLGFQYSKTISIIRN